ncbi:cytochrome c551 [Brevibacillus laterosporus]|uniref:C-type cytochrome n=1 Tax=Brevibacillus laterosporus TaxID=1465 RepID=A0AAP8QAA9_BRELA|nr:c-type cytochrome [Brevibacillus laterosporus]ATO49105.1 cytochrome C-551 [Brevibacillus laterosporus DSM 25]AYB40817.1 cytochrome C-551 [Brevibacillus laterosporus]MBG9772817.1 cytochrome C-551 [Brevibacillus laterosporus]MBG9800497.1 cytochrome C-551 [Brevibacillus laterosporus]MBG9803647.1 cytochrome C-551 [Brevibacillus laterosporus]
MKRLATVLMVGALAVGLTACGGQQSQPAPEEKPAAEKASGDTATASAGEEKFKQSSCIGCHGVDLKGATGPSLETIGSKYNKDEILEIIKNGKGSMPANMSKGEDAETIAAWLAEKK